MARLNSSTASRALPCLQDNFIYDCTLNIKYSSQGIEANESNLITFDIYHLMQTAKPITWSFILPNAKQN